MTMLTTKVLILSTLTAIAHSWTYSQAVSGGVSNYYDPEERQVFAEGTANPNITASVPVTLTGGQNFTLRVGVSDIALPGVDTSIANPRAVVTTYDILFEGDSSFNDTFMNPGPSCFDTAVGSFRGSVKKRASADGDCTDAFGEDCVEALKQVVPSCGQLGFFAPSQCDKAFKGVDGSVGFNISSQNETSPKNIYDLPSAIMTASDSADEYNDAAQEMYFVLFKNGERPSVPVCVRPSSSAAFLKAGSTMWTVATAAAAAIWMTG